MTAMLVAHTEVSYCWQARHVAALGICEQLHHTEGRKASDTTRSRALFVPAPEPSRVVTCSRHRLLSCLSDADLTKPLLIQLTDAAMDTQDLQRAWDCTSRETVRLATRRHHSTQKGRRRPCRRRGKATVSPFSMTSTRWRALTTQCWTFCGCTQSSDIMACGRASRNGSCHASAPFLDARRSSMDPT